MVIVTFVFVHMLSFEFVISIVGPSKSPLVISISCSFSFPTLSLTVSFIVLFVVLLYVFSWLFPSKGVHSSSLIPNV